MDKINYPHMMSDRSLVQQGAMHTDTQQLKLQVNQVLDSST